MVKYGSAKIVQSAGSPDLLLAELPQSDLMLRTRLTQRLATFDPVRLEPDKYLYVRNRAISAEESWGPNQNWDSWSSAELRKGHVSFRGAMLDVDHDPSLPIGQVLDSYMVPKAVVKDGKLQPFTGYNDLQPGDHVVGDWVENVWAIDRSALESFYPGAVEGILDGQITDTSMGCEIQFSRCSICDTKATEPSEFCHHIGAWGVNKGSLWPHPVTGAEMPSYERCFGVEFFEDALIMPENWNGFVGSQGADISAKILEIFARQGVASPVVKRLAGQLRLVYLRLSEDKRGQFIELLNSIK